MAAAAAKATAKTVAPLALAGTGCLVVEYKRQMTGYPWWKRVIWQLFLAVVRFCDTRLQLPTIVHHDGDNRFTIDYCGWFDSRELALRAIAAMEGQRKAAGRSGQFGWVDLPRNGVTPEQSGRYYDADFPTTPTAAYARANQRQICPFTHRLYTPSHVLDDDQLRELLVAANKTYHAAASQ